MKLHGASVMPEPSSPSVKVTFTNKDQILKALEDLIEEWTRKYPEIEQVILFGSFARGDYFPGSDVDVLILLNTSNKPFLNRIVEFLPRSFPVDIDVFPYTLEEFHYMANDPYSIVTRAVTEGKLLYRLQEP
jgi:predicted nucleotidyltransferase